MLRKLMLAGAVLTVATVPSLAASSWNIFHYGPDSDGCYVANRPAMTGEVLIAGPFSTQAAGEAARAQLPTCQVFDDD